MRGHNSLGFGERLEFATGHRNTIYPESPPPEEEEDDDDDDQDDEDEDEEDEGKEEDQGLHHHQVLLEGHLVAAREGQLLAWNVFYVSLTQEISHE